MKLYVVVERGYWDCCHNDEWANVMNVFDSKEKAVAFINKNEREGYEGRFTVVYNEDRDFYELKENETGEIYESRWYEIEERELNKEG